MLKRAHRFVESFNDPHALLDGMHQAVAPLGLKVYGAIHMPPDPAGRADVVLNENWFIHRSVPRYREFPTEYIRLADKHGPSAVRRMAWRNLGPFTYSECMRKTQAGKGERWIFDLCTKHGIRDGLICPVGISPDSGLWLLGYWSPQVLKVSLDVRRIVQSFSVHGAFRMEHLVSRYRRHRKRPRRPVLSARQSSVLQMMADGCEIKDVASKLQMSEGTVGTHIDRAARKLGAKTRAQLFSDAVRRSLIR
jgi:DNA-binding CsgD family transcriptional regulator